MKEEESATMHPMKGPAFVMWDVMTCPLPTKEAECLCIFNNISSALFSYSPTNKFGYYSLMALTVDYPPNQFSTSSSPRSGFFLPLPRYIKCDLFIVVAVHVRKMIHHMRHWARDSPGPGTYLVISGNKTLLSTLKKLHARNYNILVAHPGEHSDLAQIASCVWAFPDILQGQPPYLVQSEMLPPIFTIPQPRIPTFVLWDLKSCRLPKDERKCREVLDNIYSAVYANCSCPEITMEAVGFDNKTPSTTVDILQSDLFLVSTNRETHVSQMIHEMSTWRLSNPVPADFLVISGDAALSTALKQLHSLKYNILVAHPKVYSADLVATASRVWHFKSLVRGEPPYIVRTEADVMAQAQRVGQEPSKPSPSSIVRPKKKKGNQR